MPDLYLRNCPFCGSANVSGCMLVSWETVASFFVTCQDCHASGPKSFVSAVDAAGLWNRRAHAQDDAEAASGVRRDAAYRAKEDTDPRHYQEMDKLVDKFFREKGKGK